MMQFSRLLAFVFLFLLSSKAAEAQKLFIATDYGNCGMGIKDSSGAWVIEPHYTKITYSDHFYLLDQGSFSGMANRFGKIIIPVIYDTIEQKTIWERRNTAVYFMVSTKGKYGMIDTTNRIIVPVEYDYVKVNNDRTFLVRSGKKTWFVYHEDGTYSDMHLHQRYMPQYAGPGLYKVYKRSFRKIWHPFRTYGYRYQSSYQSKKSGLINERGEIILEKKYSSINSVKKPRDLILAKTKTQRIYYTQSGKEVFRFDLPEKQSRYSYYSEYDNSYSTINMNMYGYECVTLNKKWGLVGIKGDTILPFVYDYMSVSEIYDSWPKKRLVRVIKDSLIGMYNPDTKAWVLQPEYDQIRTITTYLNVSDSSNVTIFLATKGNKMGLISSNGETIIPFEIDTYEETGREFLISMNGSCYQLSFPGYSSTPNMRKNYSSSYSRVVDEAPASGHFQRIYTKDSTLLFIHPDLVNDSIQRAFYTSKFSHAGTFDSLLHATAIALKKREPIKNIGGETKLYELIQTGFYSDSLPYTIDILTQPSRINKKTIMYEVRNSWTDKNYTYFKTWNFILRSDGERLLKGYESYKTTDPFVDSLGNFYIRIQTKNFKYGLVNGNDKLVIDTAWNDLSYAGGNYFCVRKYEYYKKRKQYPDKYHYYNLVDARTGQTMLPAGYRSNSTIVAGYHCATVVRSFKGEGIYNFDIGNYSVPPVFNHIDKLDTAGRYFAVKTCSGKIGVVSWDGKWIADTVWTSMINASYNRPFEVNKWDYYKQNEKNLDKVVLSNNGNWLIVNTSTGTVTTSRTECDNILAQSCDNERMKLRSGSGLSKTYNFERRCLYCPTIDTTVSQSDLKTWPAWERNLLFDSLYTYETFYYDTTNKWNYRSYNTCHCCYTGSNVAVETYTFQKEYEKSSMSHTLQFRNDSCISVKRTGGYMDKHFTAMLFADGPHALVLDSLFTGNAWREYLINEVMFYLNSHLNIKGDCSNPAGIPWLLKNNFNISEAGLELYMVGYRENYQKLIIVIPWEKLKPYLREDVARKIGVK